MGSAFVLQSHLHFSVTSFQDYPSKSKMSMKVTWLLGRQQMLCSGLGCCVHQGWWVDASLAQLLLLVERWKRHRAHFVHGMRLG